MNNSPADIKIFIVDAIRVLRLIFLANMQSPTCLNWAEAIKVCLKNLPGKILHVVLHDYSSGNEKKLTEKPTNIF